MGDLVRRRPLILLLVLITAGLTIGLAITKSLVVFEVISFLVGIGSVVPQILVPMAADLAPPNRKAGAIAIIWASLWMGILLARVLSGVITNFVSFRNVYYMATGLQFATLIGAYFIIPDIPAKNIGITYPQILGSMAKLAVTEPLLIQCSLGISVNNMCFTNLWVTLTFLLLDPPFRYNSSVPFPSTKVYFAHKLLQVGNRIVWSSRNARSHCRSFLRTNARLRRTLVRSVVCRILAPYIPSGDGDWRRFERCSCDHRHAWFRRIQANDFRLADYHGICVSFCYSTQTKSL